MTVKTKDASELLGVSQTTVKRWVSYYSPYFQKDSFGHYLFSDHEISLLRFIKDQIEQGNTLGRITLPVNLVSPSERKIGLVPASREDDDVISRIREVERSLQQKADEVVSAQVLQHRAELDELRLAIAQLAASVENMQRTGTKPSAPESDFRFPIVDKTSTPAKKRGFFRSFF
ncbi:MerR family transcriptional regulator [Cohnella silvisoli]|nr:MerR family transcriptional regulator [Cohnella silvisoli]